ncbi:MAG TPA: hypothetical protein VNI01_13350, partial [Elusimicrobiota bacterium]|nr:hypothetical protein [Elusimicrobiota bacterium]
MAPAAPLLRRRLARWRLERFLSICAEGAAASVAPAGAALLAAASVDALFPLSPSGLWAAFAAVAAAAALCAYRFVLRPLRLLSARRVLSDAGARFPEIGAHLLPAWELSSVRAGEAASGSRELAREHVARTEALLAGLRPAAAFPIRVGGRAGKAA